MRSGAGKSSRFSGLGWVLWLALTMSISAAEVLPPAPAKYFSDQARVASSATADRLNKQLEDFERASSCQFVVAVFSKMESSSSLEDYCHRVFQAWKIGQKGKNNGVALFVFVQDRKLRVEVGYGLEGALPDALCKRIIDEEITPRFKAGAFDDGLSRGVNAIIQATRGEYKGTGRTAAEKWKTLRHRLPDILKMVAIAGWVPAWLSLPFLVGYAFLSPKWPWLRNLRYRHADALNVAGKIWLALVLLGILAFVLAMISMGLLSVVQDPSVALLFVGMVLITIVISLIQQAIRTTAIVFGRRGKLSSRKWSDWQTAWATASSSAGSGSSDSGGSSGGFSGGGGSSGGGGASGSW